MSSPEPSTSQPSAGPATEQIEYAPLWPACEVDLFSRNAFRLLELPITATERDIAKRREWMEKAARSNLPLPPGPARVLPRTPPPDDHELRECAHAIQDLQRRLLHEFFWFWPLEEQGDPRQDEPLRCLSQNQVERAVTLWERAPTGEQGVAARHNLAVFALLRALEAEQILLQGADAALVRQAEADWTESHRYWAALVREGRLWSRVANRIRAYNDASLPNGAARRLEASLPAGLLLLNGRLALRYQHAGRKQDAERHARWLRHQPAFAAAACETAVRLALEPLRRHIKTQCESSEREGEKDPRRARRGAEQLMQSTRGELLSLEVLLESGHAALVAERDRVALAAVSCLVTYANKTEDWEAAIPLLESALALATSSGASQRVEQNLAAARQNAEETSRWHGPGYWECGPPVVAELESAHQELEANRFDNALQAVCRLLAASLSGGQPEGQRPVLERCLAYGLNYKAVRVDRQAWALYNEDSPTLLRIVTKLRNDRTAAILSNPDLGRQVGRVQCIGCGDSIFGSFYRRKVSGLELAFCESCNEKLRREIGEQERVRNLAIEGLLEMAMLALELNPKSKQLRNNCDGFREQAKKCSLKVPANTLALRRGLGIVSFDDLQRELPRGSAAEQRELWASMERNYPARARVFREQRLEAARRLFAAAGPGGEREARAYRECLQAGGSELSASVASEAAQPLLESLKASGAEALREMEREFLAGCEIVERLWQRTKASLELVAQTVGESSGLTEQAGDAVLENALVVMQDFASQTEQWAKAARTLAGLQSLTCSNANRNQLRRQLKQAEDNAQESNWWRGENYFALPKALFQHLEAARQMVFQKNVAAGIQKLVGLLRGKTELELAGEQRGAVEQALAYCLHLQAQSAEPLPAGAPPAAGGGATGQATLGLGIQGLSL